MKNKFIIVLTFLPFICLAQDYKRNIFDYENLKLDTISVCDEDVLQILEKSFIALEENNSKNAVKIAKQEFDKDQNCPEIFEVYGYSLFRSGEWFEGIEIVEKGIEKFGSNPNLIRRRIQMSLEMAQLGTGQKHIDGNSVYKANSIKYGEEQFKTENFQSALNDLEYLVKIYDRNEEKFYIAKINQVLENYETSNKIFKALLDDEEYRDNAIFNIAENYINLKRFDDAESELNTLLESYPKEGALFEKLAEIYELKNNRKKAEEFNRKSMFYRNVPSFTNLDYSDENFDLLKFFGEYDNKANAKLKKLNKIAKSGNQEYTIDVCLMILSIHANHGNGVEEKATEILKKIGKPCLEKVHLLFQSDVSTCAITNLSDIMATVKDEDSWELLKAYLPYIAHMPMTLIPPAVPEKMIKFDEDRGIKEILIVVKELLNADSQSDELFGGFGQYAYYLPLKDVNKSKLKRIATELNYSDEEFKLLEDNIK